MAIAVDVGAGPELVAIAGAQGKADALDVVVIAEAEADPEPWSLLEITVPPGYQGASHYHRRTAQAFIVLAGALSVRVERQYVAAGPGSHVPVQPGQLHRFDNRRDEPARLLVLSAAGALAPHYARLADLLSLRPRHLEVHTLTAPLAVASDTWHLAADGLVAEWPL